MDGRSHNAPLILILFLLLLLILVLIHICTEQQIIRKFSNGFPIVILNVLDEAHNLVARLKTIDDTRQQIPTTTAFLRIGLKTMPQNFVEDRGRGATFATRPISLVVHELDEIFYIQLLRDIVVKGNVSSD